VNTNCLEGVKCPKCGQEDVFVVAVTGWTRVTDDGTDSVEGLEWAEDAQVMCPQLNCDWKGTWAQLLEPTKYQMTITFTASRKLDDLEKDSLVATVETQVSEPFVIMDPDADWVPAEWASSEITIDIHKAE
jgi:hypothetical protein